MVIDGILYGLGSLAGGVLAAWLTGVPLIAAPFFVFGAFCMYFFRDPDRTTPPGADCVSPADGKVMAVKPDQAGLTRISIFLNVFDVHVNRSPIAGRITGVRYERGSFRVAMDHRASVENEQNIVTVEGEATKVVFKQIAGLIARRIVFWKEIGNEVALGERVGLIKFGSRVDVLLPPNVVVTVKKGEHVKGGLTVIGNVQL